MKSNFYSAKLAIFGYPSTSYKQLSIEGDKESTSQWGLMKTGKITEINEDKEQIVHLISTVEGQSGAPIILKEN